MICTTTTTHIVILRTVSTRSLELLCLWSLTRARFKRLIGSRRRNRRSCQGGSIGINKCTNFQKGRGNHSRFSVVNKCQSRSLLLNVQGGEREIWTRRRLRVGLVVGCQKNGESFDKRVKGPFFVLCGKCRDELREMQVKVLQLPTNNCLISFIGSLSPTAPKFIVEHSPQQLCFLLR
jgi:hypothetical protein